MAVCPAWGPLEGVISCLLRQPIRGKSAPPSRPLGTSRDHPNTTTMRHVKVSDPHPLADLYDSVYRLSDSRLVHAVESWIHMSPISNKCYALVVRHDISLRPSTGECLYPVTKFVAFDSRFKRGEETTSMHEPSGVIYCGHMLECLGLG